MLVDAALLAVSGNEFPVVAVGAVAAGALGTLLSWVLSPLAAVLAYLSLQLSLDRGAVRRFWWGPLVGVAFVGAWLITDPPGRRAMVAYVLLSAFTAALVGLAAGLASSTIKARATGALMVVAAVAADMALDPSIYVEIHSLWHVVAAAGLLSLLNPLRRRLLTAPALGLILGAVLTVGASLLFLCVSERLAPGWRSASLADARHLTRLRLTHRALLSLDPCQLSKGGNSGESLSLGDIHAGMGLGKPAGQPGYPRGFIDLVILVTVECWRADYLNQELMPRLWQIASRGILFSRGYAGGSSTALSLPVLLRSIPDGPWLSSRLRTEGITASAVVSIEGKDDLINARAMGFQSVKVLPTGAPKTTEAALDRVGAVGRSRHFLWVHYYDTHEPWRLHDSLQHPAVRVDNQSSHWPVELRSELAYVDEALGRLYAGLREDGRLARTVLIITGDHGEALGDNGYDGHSRGGFEAVLRVPFVLVAPNVPVGEHKNLTTHRDIPPTIAGAFGVEAEVAVAEKLGRSWLRLRSAPQAKLHHFVVARSGRFVSGRDITVPMAVLVGERYKVHVGPTDEDMELYDMMIDPGETKNIAPQKSALARRMLRRLKVFCLQGNCSW